MRKDYTLIQAQEQGLDDLSFVEQFWTARWDDAGLERVGDGYRRIARREEYRFMKPYLDRLPAKARLLDAGCGIGEWTVFLAEQDFNVVGVDISEPTIAALRTRFPHLSFERGDIRQLDFPAEHFDACCTPGMGDS